MSNNKNEHSGNCAQVPSLYSGTLCKPLGPAALGDILSNHGKMLILKKEFADHILAQQFRHYSLLYACLLSRVLCQNICANANISRFRHITGHLRNTHSHNCIYAQTHPDQPSLLIRLHLFLSVKYKATTYQFCYS